MPCPYRVTGPLPGYRSPWSGDRPRRITAVVNAFSRHRAPAGCRRIVTDAIWSYIPAVAAQPTVDPIARVRLRALRCLLRHDLHPQSRTVTLSRWGRERSADGRRTTGLGVLGRAPDPFSVPRARRV